MEAFNGFDEERSPSGEDSVECLQCESAEGHHNAHYDHSCQKVICVCGGGVGSGGGVWWGGEGRGSVMGREEECDGKGGGVMGREGECDGKGGV